MFSYWYNKSKFPTATAEQLLTALAITLIDNYWIFTNIALAGQDESEGVSKTFLFLGYLVKNITLYGSVGAIQDLLHILKGSFEAHHDNSWRSYLMKGTGFVGALAATLVPNYWIFTKTPMSNDNHYSPAAQGIHKTLYMLGELFTNIELFGGLSNSIALATELKNKLLTEEHIPFGRSRL